MQNGRRIGYARVASEQQIDIVDQMVSQLWAAGATAVYTDIGALPATVRGLLAAISSMEIGDSLVYPEPCLQSLTIGDIPQFFAGVPDRSELIFFTPLELSDQAATQHLLQIKLVSADISF